MANLEVKLTLGGLDVFLQGEGELVYKVFCDLRENGLGLLSKVPSPENNTLPTIDGEDLKHIPRDISGTQTTSGTQEASKSKGKRKNATSSFQLLKDLDLNGKAGSIKSLKDFVSEKNPAINIHKTAVFVYYLETIMGLDEITIDHIYTCYKAMNYRVPKNLQQNLNDASGSRYGYIDRKDWKYSVTVIGSNFVEHDLPKRV